MRTRIRAFIDGNLIMPMEMDAFQRPFPYRFSFYLSTRLGLLRFYQRVHFHIDNLAVLNSIFAQYPFQNKT